MLKWNIHESTLPLSSADTSLSSAGTFGFYLNSPDLYLLLPQISCFFSIHTFQPSSFHKLFTIITKITLLFNTFAINNTTNTSMHRKAYISIIIVCTIFSLPLSSFAQIPTQVFEITNLLVDGCDGGNEGKNEMVLFQIGPNPVNITDLRVDGAGSNGVIIPDKWPNTSNSWKGIATPPAKPAEVTAINATITNCGVLIEPVGGILPAGKKVLMITSTDFNPTAHSFATLGDTLYVIFQVAGNTAGHFVNWGSTGTRTLRLVHVPSMDSDTVIYTPNLLVNQLGQIGAQDGASVKYTFSGLPTYYNPGCQAPYTPLSAAWINPDSVCQTAAPIDLNTLITGATGGTWKGTGVTGNLFNPSGLSGNIDITYKVGFWPCTDSVTQTIRIIPLPDASWTSPAPVCESAAPVDLSTLITGTAGGTWSGAGVTGTMFNPSGLNGNISVTYQAGSSTCWDSVTHFIQVFPLADASWTNPGLVCQSTPSIDLTTLITGTPGGTWSGTGVSGTIFNPAGLIGNINVTYTAGTGACATSLTQTIQVVSIADASWTSPTLVCQSASPVNLNALITGTSGGTWSGVGVIDTIFDPAGLSGSSVNITYTVSAPPCYDSQTHAIQVSPDADASWTNPGLICQTSPAINLSTYITGNTGGTWSGTGIINVASGLFDPAVAGPGNYLITYSVPGICPDSEALTIVVLPLPNAGILSTGPYCDNLSPFSLSAATTGGIWSGSGITNSVTGTFNPALAGAGTHTIVYQITGNCSNSDTADIAVLLSPLVTVTGASENCNGALDGTATASVTGGSAPYSYIWSNSAIGVVITDLAPGHYSVTVTDTNNCFNVGGTDITASSEPCETIVPVIYVPNVFTPNGDGNNDILFVRGRGILTLKFFVFDRWGEKVFETTDPSMGWNGTFRGESIDAAVYVYYLHAEFIDGNSVKDQGNITLIR
jgi:gliding motility-associated-like protein